jgi:Zn finger protein HypA/HybF involved in hydrogenase expression
MKLEKLEIPEMEISCPGCNNKFKARIQEAQDAEPLTCPNCHREIIDAGSFGSFLDGFENVS